MDKQNESQFEQKHQNQNQNFPGLHFHMLNLQNVHAGVVPDQFTDKDENDQEHAKTINIKQFVLRKEITIQSVQAGICQSLPLSLIEKLTNFVGSFQTTDKKITQAQIKFIQQINHSNFDVKNNFKFDSYQAIFSEVCSIRYQNLTTINISSMKIRNIEALQFLCAPNVITMQMYGNQIRTLKPLIKNSTMKKLATITFYFNPIGELTDLYKTNMMKLSHFQYDGSLDCRAVQNLNPLFKNPLNRFKTLYIQSHKRLYQPKIIQMLKKKNNQESVYFPNLVSH